MENDLREHKFISKEYSISDNDYYLNSPLVDENLEELDVDFKDEILSVIEIEEEKLLTIEVNDFSMVPTAIMFSLKDHFYVRKLVILHKTIPGWQYLASFFVSGHIDNIILR